MFLRDGSIGERPISLVGTWVPLEPSQPSPLILSALCIIPYHSVFLLSSYFSCLLFVALRAPPATSSAAIGVGSAAPLTLSLSSSFFPFSAFFFLQLSPLSPAGLSHTSTRAEWGGGPFRAALTAHGPRRRRPPAAAAAAAAAAAFLH